MCSTAQKRLEHFRAKSGYRFCLRQNAVQNKKLERITEPSEVKTALDKFLKTASHFSELALFVAFFICTTLYTAHAQQEEIQDYAGNSENGAQVFRRCVACHYADEEKNKVGPSLKNLIGSQAGTKDGYRYSPAMNKAGEEGLVWNRETLIEFLRNPQAMVRGTRMAAVRITSDQDVDDLIAYIIKASQDEEQDNQNEGNTK